MSPLANREVGLPSERPCASRDTRVTPSVAGNRPGATVNGPGPAPSPASGCGYAVERAV